MGKVSRNLRRFLSVGLVFVLMVGMLPHIGVEARYLYAGVRRMQDAPNQIVTYAIETSVSPAGSGTVSGGGVVNQGQEVTLAATPNTGWEFIGWYEANVRVHENSPWTFNATADRTLEARFEEVTPPANQIPVHVHAVPTDGGTVTGGGNFARGQEATVYATPNAGWRFIAWQDVALVGGMSQVVSVSPSFTFTVERERSLIAVFERIHPVVNRFVRFTYPNFHTAMSVAVSDMAHFEIGVHLSDPRILLEEEGRFGTYTWLRNGVPWTGTGGSGTLSFCEDGHAEVHLVLPAGLTHLQRGGIWHLRIDIPGLTPSRVYGFPGFLQIIVPDVIPPTPIPTPQPPIVPLPPPTPVPTPVPVDPYALFGNLEGIVCPATAAEAVRQAFLQSTPQDLADGLLELFAETAIMYASTRHVNLAGIQLNAFGLAQQEADASLARLLIGEVFQSVRHVPQRDLRLGVAVSTPVYEHIRIGVDRNLATTRLDFVWVRTPHYSIGFTRDFLRNNADGEIPLSIDVTTGLEYLPPFAPEMFLAPAPTELRDVPVVTPPPIRVPTGPAAPPLWPLGSGIGFNPALAPELNGGRQEMRTYTITFNQTVTEPVRLAVEPNEGTRATQVVRNVETASIQPSRNNRVTGNLDTRLLESGTYVVVENEVGFTDVLNLSIEMQNAISILAAQGILHGFTRLEFMPNLPITRAQAASIFARMLSIEDANIASGFDDVHPGDWFHNAVSSVSRAGVMSGHSSVRFGPNEHLPKVQLAVLSARVLRREMQYHLPENPQAVLQAEFGDWVNLPDWSRSYVAMATRENLITPRGDGNFMPNSVLTRGEVALMLHRLYLRLW